MFHRERKRIVLTDLGQLMQPHLQQVLGETEAAHTVAENFRRLHHAPLTVGAMMTIGPVRLGRFLAGFQQRYPGIEVAVQDGGLDDLSVRLESGTLDLAVLSAPEGLDPAFRSQPLYTERYVVVFPPGHRFEGLDAIRLKDVSGEAYVDRLACEMRDLVTATCKTKEVELYATFQSEREDWIQGMVMADMGFAFMPEYSVTLGALLSRPLIDPVVERTVSLVSPPDRRHSPAAAVFAREARTHRWPG